jgi:hypothetical protein
MPTLAHRSRRVRTAGLGLLLGLALTATAAPAATLAAGSIQVRLTNPGCSFAFTGQPDTTYAVDLVRSGANVASTRDPVTTDGAGNASVACEAWDRLRPTDIIRSLDVLSFTPIGGGSKKNVPIPPLTLTFNRLNDTILGTTTPLPNNRFDSGKVWFCAFPGDDCTSMNTRPAAGSGSFSIPLGDRDLRGGDVVELTGTYVLTDFGDRVTFLRYVPYARVQRGSAIVEGYARPLSTVRIKFVNADGNVVAGGAKAARADGFYSITVRKGGTPFPLKNGLRVMTNLLGVVRGFSNLDVDLSEAASDVLSGTCYSGRPYAVTVAYPEELALPPVTLRGTAELGTGAFRIEFATGAPIAAGATVTMDCSDKDGDVFTVVKTVS